MADAFDPIEYLTYLRRNGKFAALAIVSAAVLTLGISLVLPKQYTATATLVIEPPVANDPRAATAVTPVYLESLKTYEQFAGSDSLFAKACAKFAPADASCDESYKRRVLRVIKLKDTKVMQISATLPDAKRAQQLVEYLASETVALNRSLARDGDRETQADIQTQLAAANKELDLARGEFESAVSRGADALLDEELRTLSDLKAQTTVEALRSRATLAELQSRKDAGEAAAEQARLKSLTDETAEIDNKLTTQSMALAAVRAQRDRASERLRVAEAKHEAWLKRTNEAAVATGLRTEQLRVVDSGVVPQRPSFPNPPLFTVVAVLLSALLALAYLSLRYGLERQRLRTELESIESDYKAARGGHH